ncbi:hypothetical protein D3C81_2317240 [compost metagenome]
MQILLLDEVYYGFRNLCMSYAGILVVPAMSRIFGRIDGMTQLTQFCRRLLPKACIHPGPMDQYKG